MPSAVHPPGHRTATILALALAVAPVWAELAPEALPGVTAFAVLKPRALERAGGPRVNSFVSRLRDRATALYGVDLAGIERAALAFKGASAEHAAILIFGEAAGAVPLANLFSRIFGGSPRQARVGEREIVFTPGILSGVAEPNAMLLAPEETAASFVGGPGQPPRAMPEFTACLEPLAGADPDFLLFAVSGTWLAGQVDRHLAVSEAASGVRALALALAGDALVLSFALEREADPDALVHALKQKREEDETLAALLSFDGAATRETSAYARFRLTQEALTFAAAEAARTLYDYFPEDKRIEAEILACSTRCRDLKLLLATGRIGPKDLNRKPEHSCPHGGILLDRESPEGISVRCTRHGFNLD